MNQPQQIADALKQRLKESTDFKVAADYFLDVVARLPDMRAAKRLSHARLQCAVAVAVAYALGEKVDPDDVMVSRLPDTDLLHGMVVYRGAACVFFYFSDEDLGLLVISPFADGQGTALIRLSLFELPDGAWPAPPPKAADS